MIPTPQLQLLPPEALPAEMRAAYERALALRGDATFVQVAGHAPELFDWYREFYQRVFYGGRVPVRIKAWPCAADRDEFTVPKSD